MTWIRNAFTAAVAVACLSSMGTACGQASLAPPPQTPDEPLENGDKGNRVVIGAVGLYAGSKVIRETGYAARTVARKVPTLRGLGPYSQNISKLPVIGRQVLKTRIPTSLGRAPFIGGKISEIPVVGSTIAGPPNPCLVGAVAVDTYLLPKYAPCGWTESAIFTNTDFNSEPYLRQYVNYLAPLPYTHPPIYAPGPLSPGQADAISLEGTVVPATAITQPDVGTVSIEY